MNKIYLGIVEKFQGPKVKSQRAFCGTSLHNEIVRLE